MTTTAAVATGATGRRRTIGLAEAWREFWRWGSPRIILGVLVPTFVARVAVGGLTAGDAVLAAAIVGGQPFLEWVVHVTVLHMRPFDVRGRTVDPLVARKHREHHADPRDTELVFIPLPVLVGTLVVLLVLALLAIPDLGLGLTFLTVTSALGLVYEWTHYLIHTDYRPRTGLYRRLWRNHRLHHFKNENYWYTITNDTPDRLLGTDPDPADVETSPTARDLLGAGDAR